MISEHDGQGSRVKGEGSKRVLVIGAAGQLGRALTATFREGGHEVVEAVRRLPEPGQVRLDLEQGDALVAALAPLNPEWILIAGAFCDVDGAETQREACWRANVEGPRAIAELARACDATVVYYSSDQVFDGAATDHAEGDPVNPLNAYAASKAAGEATLRRTLPASHVIVRAAWHYGPDPSRRNFALRLVDRLARGEPVRVPSDQLGTPTYTQDVAAVTRFLLESGHRGTFHAAGPELIDRVTLAHRVCDAFGLDPAGIVPTPTAALGQAARRPLRVRLDCRKVDGLGAPARRGVAEGLAALRQWQAVVSQR